MKAGLKGSAHFGANGVELRMKAEVTLNLREAYQCYRVYLWTPFYLNAQDLHVLDRP